MKKEIFPFFTTKYFFSIKINIKPGELVAIVGHVGCGKSSLISAMLGEMEKQEGYVGLRVVTAYYLTALISLNVFKVYLLKDFLFATVKFKKIKLLKINSFS